MSVDYLYILITGLAMSFTHCPLMCGAISTMMPRQIPYHLGRSLGYICLNVLAFYLGSALKVSNASAGAMYFFIGCFMAFLGVALGFKGKVLALIENSKLSAQVASYVLRALRRKSFAYLFAAGLLNAFLPCGMVYFYLASAILASNVFGALLCGVLLSLLSCASLISTRFVLKAAFFRYLGPILVVLNGCYLAFKGVMLYE